MADTALKTANSGYDSSSSRRADLVVTEDDCGTDRGLLMAPRIEGGDIVQPLGERILGRVVAEDVLVPGVRATSLFVPVR